MKYQVKVFDNIALLTQFFIQTLDAKINENSGNSMFSWLLSGGVTPIQIFRKMSEYHGSINWDRVMLFWGDERCVGPAHAQSNYRMAKEHLLPHISIPKKNIFRIRGEENPLAEANRYAEQFKIKVFHENALIPKVDIAFLGLGVDGHTASIFPENIDIFDSKNFFLPVIQPVTNQCRITATGQIINNAKTVIIIAVGQSKANTVAQVILEQSGWEQLPISRVRPENGRLIWLLDKEAASRL